MQQKRQPCFEQGAQEVWLCNEQGEMTFYNQNSQLMNSILTPKFQQKISLDD